MLSQPIAITSWRFLKLKVPWGFLFHMFFNFDRSIRYNNFNWVTVTLTDVSWKPGPSMSDTSLREPQSSIVNVSSRFQTLQYFHNLSWEDDTKICTCFNSHILKLAKESIVTWLRYMVLMLSIWVIANFFKLGKPTCGIDWSMSNKDITCVLAVTNEK